MELSQWIDELKKCKPGPQTALYHVKVTTNSQHTEQTVRVEKECPHCGQRDWRSCTVKFKEPHQLTIFEAGLLYAVFVLNKKPVDYAQLHKTPAGEMFIRNIEV